MQCQHFLKFTKNYPRQKMKHPPAKYKIFPKTFSLQAQLEKVAKKPWALYALPPPTRGGSTLCPPPSPGANTVNVSAFISC